MFLLELELCLENMKIVEPDFIMEPSGPDSEFYDLTFMKRVKKRDTGKFEIEPGNTLYALTLSHCLNKIAHKRTAKKWEEDNITLNIHSIGLGYDTDYSDLEAYEQQKKAGTLSRTLQFITQKYRYDASTKKADWVRDCENCVFGAKVDRNIPLSDSEVSSLLENTRYK